MAWKENSVMDQRMRFVLACGSPDWTMTELCEMYGVSRTTGYKWLGRHAADGPPGLADRSRAPHEHGRATAAHLSEAIVALRLERPSWGPRKIIARLAARAPGADWPAASTAGEILKRAGLVGARRFKRRGPPRLGELTQPCHCNHVWIIASFRVRWKRSWRPFCCGCPGSIRSCAIPSLIHHADSCVSPPAPVEANGEPLSDRITCGRPNASKARSNRGLASSCLVLPVAPTPIRNRLKPSVIVKGSLRVPSKSLTQPL